MLSKRLIKFLIGLLLFTLLILLSFYLSLRSGISLSSIELLGYKAQNLNIKLNDKFTLKVSSISKNSENISKKVKNKKKYNQDRNLTKRPPLLANVVLVKKYLNRVIDISKFFEYISLESIKFRGNNYLASFRDSGLLHFAGEKFEFSGKLIKKPDKFLINYPNLYLKKYKLTLDGNLTYSTTNGDINLTGRYKIADINGSYKVDINSQENLVNFELDSKKVESLKKLLDLFRMNYITKEWLYNRIRAKKYKLIYLKGRAKIEGKRVKPILNSIEAMATLEDLNVTFHSKLPQITSNGSVMILKNGQINFDFSEPKYQNREISGSWVKLINIYDKKSLKLKLHILYNGVMDKTLIHILNTYNIPVTIRQEGGKSFGVLDIDIPLQKGKRATYYSTIDIKDGFVVFGKNRYKVNYGRIVVDGKVIKLKKMKISLKNITGIVDGVLDITQRKGDFNIFVKSFFLPLGMGYLKIKNKKIPISISWKKNSREIKIPTMKTKIKIKKNSFEIETKKLSLWRDYSGGFLKLFSGGDVKIINKNGVYNIDGNIYWKNCPLCIKRKSIKKWGFDLKVTKKGLKLASRGKSVIYDSRKKLLKIKNLNIDNTLLQKMLKNLKELNSRQNLKLNKKTSRKRKRRNKDKLTLKIIGKNSAIFYPKFTLKCDKYILNLYGNNKDFKCFMNGYRVDVTLDHYGIKRIYTKNIDDRSLNSVFGYRPIQNTKYKINIKRYNKKNYRGSIWIKGGVIKKLKSYNDLISFINTIPAILTFTNPGFSDKGFELKKGRIKFDLRRDIFHLKTLLLDGTSSSIAGKGIINIKSQRLNLDLAIQTAKEMGKFIGSIPIIGYILLGDDKSMTIGVKVKGTLKKPDIQASPVGEALTYPLELLKRTLTLPSKIQEESKKANKKRDKY